MFRLRSCGEIASNQASLADRRQPHCVRTPHAEPQANGIAGIASSPTLTLSKPEAPHDNMPSRPMWGGMESRPAARDGPGIGATRCAKGGAARCRAARSRRVGELHMSMLSFRELCSSRDRGAHVAALKRENLRATSPIAKRGDRDEADVVTIPGSEPQLAVWQERTSPTDHRAAEQSAIEVWNL